MQVYDIARSLVTNVLLVSLLFTLAQPKVSKKKLCLIFIMIVAMDLALNILFYLQNDYTALAVLDVAFFVLVGFAIKPLFYETLMQWLFNFFTVMNIYAIIVVISYFLCDYFPYPFYANTVLRALLFFSIIVLFRHRLRPLYRQAAENWSVYLFVAVGLFVYFMFFFLSGDDVEASLMDHFIPLILLSVVTILTYMSIFLSLRKTLHEVELREEKIKLQSDWELNRHRLALMDEAMRQMSIMQHDSRHFNHTLMNLLQQGQTDKAIEMISRQSEMLPYRPQCYCENISVNAAVSYYAEMIRQKEIHSDLRLNIPNQLCVDELSLAMVVSNLMENAINAVADLPKEKREIKFTAVYTGQLILEIINAYEGEVLFDQKGLPITQSVDHGRGSQSISDFVNRYGGDLLYETSDGFFKVRIIV